MATLQAKSIRRREDERLLTGSGNYAADGKRDGHAGGRSGALAARARII